MNEKRRILLPAIAATIVPTIVTTFYFGVIMLIARDPNPKTITLIMVLALVISTGHVLFLGLPAVYLLKKFGYLRGWSVTLAGFIVGCIPMGIWSWPIDHSKYPSSYSYWDGAKTVQARIDGIPTMVGWIDYTTGMLWIGALGAIAGIAFWLAWSKKRSNLQFDTDAMRRST
jgi:hypothetical protein